MSSEINWAKVLQSKRSNAREWHIIVMQMSMGTFCKLTSCLKKTWSKTTAPQWQSSKRGSGCVSLWEGNLGNADRTKEAGILEAGRIPAHISVSDQSMYHMQSFGMTNANKDGLLGFISMTMGTEPFELPLDRLFNSNQLAMYRDGIRGGSRRKEVEEPWRNKTRINQISGSNMKTKTWPKITKMDQRLNI